MLGEAGSGCSESDHENDNQPEYPGGNEEAAEVHCPGMFKRQGPLPHARENSQSDDIEEWGEEDKE